jgi:hypothetical protein
VCLHHQQQWRREACQYLYSFFGHWRCFPRGKESRDPQQKRWTQCCNAKVTTTMTALLLFVVDMPCPSSSSSSSSPPIMMLGVSIHALGESFHGCGKVLLCRHRARYLATGFWNESINATMVPTSSYYSIRYGMVASIGRNGLSSIDEHYLYFYRRSSGTVLVERCSIRIIQVLAT